MILPVHMTSFGFRMRRLGGMAVEHPPFVDHVPCIWVRGALNRFSQALGLKDGPSELFFASRCKPYFVFWWVFGSKCFVANHRSWCVLQGPCARCKAAEARTTKPWGAPKAKSAAGLLKIKGVGCPWRFDVPHPVENEQQTTMIHIKVNSRPIMSAIFWGSQLWDIPHVDMWMCSCVFWEVVTPLDLFCGFQTCKTCKTVDHGSPRLCLFSWLLIGFIANPFHIFTGECPFTEVVSSRSSGQSSYYAVVRNRTWRAGGLNFGPKLSVNNPFIKRLIWLISI